MTLIQKITGILVLSVIFMACGSSEQPEQIHPHDAFFNNLTSLCGQMFSGGSTYPENDAHPLVGTELRTHLSLCEDDVIRIDLYRDTDYWHGTWVLEKREEGLHLFHDHLGDHRTEEYLEDNNAYHGYGGFANNQGSALRQYFPADEVTAEIIPEAATNVWMMDIDLDNQIFTYYLERHSEPRFRAVVDLSNLVN